MKKLFVLFLLLVVGVIPAAAIPVDELTELAAFVPSDSVFFATVRTDDAYIETLDSVIESVASQIPGVPPVTLSSGLDMLSQQASGGDFEEVFRPWLGDRAAFAFTNLEAADDEDRSNNFEAFVLIFEITDREGAVDYLETVSEGRYEVTEEADYTLFTAPLNENDFESLPPVLVTEDALFLGDVNPYTQGDIDDPLSDSETFTTALDTLPEDEYNILLYLDTPEVVRLASMNNMNVDPTTEAALSVVGTTVVGFTILDGRSLTIDVVQESNPEAMQALTGVTDFTMGTIDPEFARYIPVNTPAVIHSTNLATTYENALTTLRTLAEAQGEETVEEFEQGLSQATVVLRGLTGLDLEEDIVAWMTGDYALYVGLNPALADADSMADVMGSLPVDFGLVIDASEDPEAALALVEGLQSAVEFGATQTQGSAEIEVDNEEIAGVEALVVTITDPMQPFLSNVELLAAANEDVFVLGTRNAVLQALEPGESLADDPAFQDALQYILPQSGSVAYLAGGGLLPVVDLLPMLDSSPSSAQNAAVLEGVLNAWYSSSTSSQLMEDGTQVTRLVLTVPAE